MTPDQEHLVITSLTWPHYLLNVGALFASVASPLMLIGSIQWLQSRDTLDAEDFVDVIDFLIHSSFYALSIPRRFDVLFSIVDEVNSSPQLCVTFKPALHLQLFSIRSEQEESVRYQSGTYARDQEQAVQRESEGGKR